MRQILKFAAGLGFILMLQCQYTSVSAGGADDDSDTIDWSALQAAGGVDVADSDWEIMRKHMTEEEIKQLMSKIATRQVRRAKRETAMEDREKRLPRLGIRSPLPRLGLRDTSEGEKVSREKRLPRMGIRSPLPRFGIRSSLPRIGEDERNKRLPRMGKRESLTEYLTSSDLDDSEDRDKRLPRFGRAAPFPRLGRAAPFPRLGRASPFPRLGRSEVERAAPFPRLGRSSWWLGNPDLDTNYESELMDSDMPRIAERASPFPRLG